MPKYYPGRAKTMRGQLRPNPRWAQTKINNGYKFRKAQPSRWKWGGEVKSNTGAYNTVSVDGNISNSIRNGVRVKNIPANKLEEWWCIENGVLPPGEKQPPTDEEMEEKALEEITPVEEAAKAAIDNIKEEARIESNRLEAEAEEYESDMNPKTRPNSLAKARRRRSDAADVREEANQQVAIRADQLREERDEIKERLKKEQQDAIDEANDRLEELKKNLLNDIENTVNTVYFNKGGADFELLDYTLS